MAEAWYCRVNGQARGPFSFAKLRQLIAAGKVTGETPVRQGEQGVWVHAAKVQQLLEQDSVGETASPKPAAKTSRKVPRAVPHETAAATAASAYTSAAAAQPGEPSPDEAAPPPPRKPPKPAVPRAKPISESAAAPVAVAGASGPGSVTDTVRARRRGSLLPLLVGGAIVLMLAVGAGILALASMFADPSSVADAIQPTASNPGDGNNEETSAPAPASSGSDDDVELEGPAAPAAPSGNAEMGADGGAASAGDPSLAIRSVDKWRPAIGRVGGTKSLKARFDSVWLGSDPNRDANGPEFFTGNSGAPRFVFVRLVINNPSQGAVEYPAWNFGSERAVMVDDQNAVCELVSMQEAQTARLEPTTLGPGGSATDVLVFRLPNREFAHLRLALPFGRAGYYGLQIEPAMLSQGNSGEPDELVIQPPEENDPVFGGVDSLESEPAERPQPRPAPPRDKPEPKPKGQPDFRELQEAIEKTKEEEEKAKEAEGADG